MVKPYLLQNDRDGWVTIRLVDAGGKKLPADAMSGLSATSIDYTTGKPAEWRLLYPHGHCDHNQFPGTENSTNRTAIPAGFTVLKRSRATYATDRADAWVTDV